MADEEDDELAALRNAVLASMKSKPKPAPPAVPREDDVDLEALRVAALRTKKLTQQNTEPTTNPYGQPAPPVQPVETVSTLSRSPLHNSPYRDQPGSPHRPNFHQPRRGGYGPRNGPPFNPQPRNRPPFNPQPRNGPPFNPQPRNGPPFIHQARNTPPFNVQSRNAPQFNVQNRPSNLIVLTAAPVKPAGDAGQKPAQKAVPAIMVRPQDKWSGSGVTAAAQVKEKKPKGPARFSRLESDSDSDESEAESEQSTPSSSSSSSDSEDEDDGDKKEGSDQEPESPPPRDMSDTDPAVTLTPASPRGNTADDGEVVKAKNTTDGGAHIEKGEDRGKEVQSIDSIGKPQREDREEDTKGASPAVAGTVEKDVSGANKETLDLPSDSISATKPDYTRVPPPAPFPASSPNRRPLVDEPRPRGRPSPLTNRPQVGASPEPSSQGKTAGPKERTSVHSRLGSRQGPAPEKQNPAVKDDRPTNRSVALKTDNREEAVLEARRQKFAESRENPADRSLKTHMHKDDVKPQSSSSSEVQNKKSPNKDKSPKDTNVTDTKVNGQSGVRRNSRLSRPRSSHSRSSGGSSSSSDASEAESDTSTSRLTYSDEESDSEDGRRGKHKAVERGQDDIERERRQRMAREREERRAQRHSRDGRGQEGRERRDRLNDRPARDRDQGRKPGSDQARSSRHHDRQTQQRRQEPRELQVREKKPYSKEESRHRGSLNDMPIRDESRTNRGKSRSSRSHDRPDKRPDSRKPERSVRSDSASRPAVSGRERSEQSRNQKAKGANMQRLPMDSDSDSDLSLDSPPQKLRSVTQVVDYSEERDRGSPSHQTKNKQQRDSGSRGREEPVVKTDHVRSHKKDEGAKPTRIIIEEQSRDKRKDAREIICRLKKEDGGEIPERDNDKQTKHSPKINITFNKEPELEGKSTKSRVSVHDRLGVPVKQKGRSEVPEDEPKVTRRVITEDPADVRHRLKDKKKERVVTEDLGDARHRLKEKNRDRSVTEDLPDIPQQRKEKKKSRERKISLTEPVVSSDRQRESKKGSGKRPKDYGIWSSHQAGGDQEGQDYDMEVPRRSKLEDRLGQQRHQPSPQSSPAPSPTHSPEPGLEDIRSKLNKKRKKRSLEDRLGVQSVVASSSGRGSRSGDEGGKHKRRHLVWSTHDEPADRVVDEPRRKRSKTTEPTPPGKKGNPAEDELNARIERIRKQNAELERRKKEIDRDKERSIFR